MTWLRSARSLDKFLKNTHYRMQSILDFHPWRSSIDSCPCVLRQGDLMLDDAETVSLRSDPGEAPAIRRGAPQNRPDRPDEPSPSEKESRSPRRRRLRGALFLMLPLVLIAGGYAYVTGGQVMSTDDA